MPKSQIVEPQKERKTGKLTCPDIPLNQYSGTVEDELERYGPEALVGIYEDMFLIREFENMLQVLEEKFDKTIVYNRRIRQIYVRNEPEYHQVPEFHDELPF